MVFTVCLDLFDPVYSFHFFLQNKNKVHNNYKKASPLLIKNLYISMNTLNTPNRETTLMLCHPTCVCVLHGWSRAA